MNATALGFLALLIVAGAGFLWFRAMQRVQVPKNRVGFLTAMFGAAVLGMIALAEGPFGIADVPAVFAIIGGVIFWLLVAISPQKVGADVIRVHSTIPEFAAPDEDGEMFHSSSLAGHPVLIKFFRGHW